MILFVEHQPGQSRWRAAQQAVLRFALRRFGGRKKPAAKWLGVARETMRRQCQRHGLPNHSPRAAQSSDGPACPPHGNGAPPSAASFRRAPARTVQGFVLACAPFLATAAPSLTVPVVYQNPTAVCFRIDGLRSNDWCELQARSVGFVPGFLTNNLGIVHADTQTNGRWFVAHRFTATGPSEQISFDTQNWAAAGAHFRLLNHGPLPPRVEPVALRPAAPRAAGRVLFSPKDHRTP